MSTTITQQNIAMAQFKFALIAPVIQGLYPDASRMAYYKRVTKDPLKNRMAQPSDITCQDT